MADLASIWSDLDTGMELVLESFKEEAQKLRAGSVNVEVLKNINVKAYGADMPLYQVATISTPSAVTAVITPWDKNNVKFVFDAVMAELSGEATPSAKDNAVYLNYQPLTQEKKQEYVKMLKDRSEHFRQQIRDVRQSAKSKLEDMKKASELPEDDFFKSIEDLDETTKKFTDQINEVYENKKESLLK